MGSEDEPPSVLRIANATDNFVTINSGASILNGNVYGWHIESANSSASATNNTVTINGGSFGATSVIYGGYRTGASGKAFSYNTLKLNSNTNIFKVANFATVEFGDIGTANISNLDTTATGATVPQLVNLFTNHDITFSGVIFDTGGIEKSENGTGTLTLTGTNAYTGGATVSAGALEAGDLSGSLTVSGGTVTMTGAVAGTVINTGGIVTVNGIPAPITSGGVGNPAPNPTTAPDNGVTLPNITTPPASPQRTTWT